jgi:hypothetical protein
MVKTAAYIFLKIILIIVLMGGGRIDAIDQDKPLAKPLAKKQIPMVTFKNLFPPFTDEEVWSELFFYNTTRLQGV